MVSPKWKALALALMLTGCQTAPGPVSNPRQVWCDQNEPWRPSIEALAHMTRQEKEDGLAHNLKGAAWCGWKPAKGA